MKKLVIALIVIFVIAGVALYLLQEKPGVEQEEERSNQNEIEQVVEETVIVTGAPSSEFIECLGDAGIVIYGSATCPYCKDLVDTLGGYEAASSIYVECTQEGDRCSDEMQTGYVPEVQLNGELLKGIRKAEDFVASTGCEL